MRAPIAKLRIAAGNPGWYDPLTNIHLTITRPEAFVYEGSNTTNIKKGVAHRLVYVVEGSLATEEVVVEQPQETVAVKEEVREVAPQVETKTEEVATEEIVQVEEAVEAVEETKEAVEEVAEEVVEEKPKAKKTTTRKKATTKKTEEK